MIKCLVHFREFLKKKLLKLEEEVITYWSKSIQLSNFLELENILSSHWKDAEYLKGDSTLKNKRIFWSKRAVLNILFLKSASLLKKQWRIYFMWLNLIIDNIFSNLTAAILSLRLFLDYRYICCSFSIVNFQNFLRQLSILNIGLFQEEKECIWI